MTSPSSPSEPLDFRRRWTGTELMDDPTCDEAMLLRTVDQFVTINRLVSRYRSILARLILDDMARTPDRSVHVIDLGAGGCDIPAWLLGQAAKRNLKLSVTALDSEPRIARHARQRHRHLNGLTIVVDDLSNMSAYGPADYVFANHVLHHLPDEVIPSVLQTMRGTATRRWIVSDLLRSRWSYLGFQVLGRFYRHSFAFEDGKRSIRRGFRRDDVTGYLKAIGGTDLAVIEHLVPGRILWYGPGTSHPASPNLENPLSSSPGCSSFVPGRGF